LGNGRLSQFELETLDELIARRYNAGRTTLFATNYSLDPDKKGVRAPPGGHISSEDITRALRDMELPLRERVKERIYSRLCEMCTFIEFPKQTPDMRRQKQEMKEESWTVPPPGRTRSGR
jgi:DNA replication protein DnaC